MTADSVRGSLVCCAGAGLLTYEWIGGMLMFVHASSVLVAIPFMMLHRATVSTVFHSSC